MDIPSDEGANSNSNSLLTRVWNDLLIEGIRDRSLFFITPILTRKASLLGPSCVCGT